MNNKTSGLLLLLSILVIGLFVQLLWKPMNYLEGLTNATTNKYDTAYTSGMSVLNTQAASFSQQSPEMIQSMNATLGTELNEIMASNVYQTLSTSNEDFTPLMTIMKSLTPQNASMLSQVLTTVIQFLTDLKSHVLTANSNVGTGDGIVSTTINSALFSKNPKIIA